MYDEYERAVGGGGRRGGPSPLVWFLVVFGLFAVTGAVAAGFAVKRGLEAVRDVAGALGPDRSVAGVADRLRSHASLLTAEPDRGLAWLESLDAAEPRASLLGDLGSAMLDPGARHGPEPTASREETRADASGAGRRIFTLRAGDEELRIDLDRRGEGGSLVIGSGDDEFRLDLVETEHGGALVLDSGEDQARVDVVRTEAGGRLTVDTPDGVLRFDLAESDEGGSLVVRADDDEVLRLGMGESARGVPRWVPRWSGMPARPEPVYSLASGEGFLGAVTWDEEAAPGNITDFYVRRLTDDGYRLEAEARDRGGAVERNALWARHPDSGRVVFLLVRQTDRSSRVLLGYGERKPG
ncbi:MAG: hypothetical protein P8188_13075 [Gemmatimonadota bacterium]|jgi:hypothetical protein